LLKPICYGKVETNVDPVYVQVVLTTFLRSLLSQFSKCLQ